MRLSFVFFSDIWLSKRANVDKTALLKKGDANQLLVRYFWTGFYILTHVKITKCFKCQGKGSDLREFKKVANLTNCP